MRLANLKFLSRLVHHCDDYFKCLQSPWHYFPCITIIAQANTLGKMNTWPWNLLRTRSSSEPTSTSPHTGTDRDRLTTDRVVPSRTWCGNITKREAASGCSTLRPTVNPSGDYSLLFRTSSGLLRDFMRTAQIAHCAVRRYFVWGTRLRSLLPSCSIPLWVVSMWFEYW